MREIISPLSGIRSPFGGRSLTSPFALFAFGEQGVWFDPSDLTTLFQDTAGTTPVTTPGQSVGLMLDKSRGLVLGSELVTNGDFSDGSTGWTATGSASLSVVSGALRVTNGAASTGGAIQVINTTAGTTYRWTYYVDPATSGGAVIRVRDGGTLTVISTATRTVAGTFTLLFVATGSTTQINCINSSSTIGVYHDIDNISVKELPGNHAVQATTANRPIYGIHPFGGRRNLLVRTEEFENASWTKANATVSGSTLTAINSSNSARVQQPFAATSGQQRTATFRVSAGTSTSTGMRILDSTNTVYARIDMTWTAGVPTIAASTGADSATITSVGGGEYDAVLVFTPLQTATQNLAYYIDLGSLNRTAVLSRAQLETGSTATAYQRVTDQYNVTEAGVSSVSYLFFDGVNDSLATSTITPGTDKAQVFAGVRKLSDTNSGILAELSADWGSNTGSWFIHAPETGGTGSYSSGSRGNAALGLSQRVLILQNAPDTAVLASTHDISGDLTVFRRNGTAGTNATADKGAGNFGNYPLFVGARNNASLFFSGHLYSLIARFGANLATGQISSTETWVAGKTGITI